jgi:hypothetical protein
LNNNKYVEYCPACFNRSGELNPIKRGFFFCESCLRMEYRIVSERKRQLIKQRREENDRGKKDIKEEAERSL